MTENKLLKRYYELCTAIINEFCKKQDLEFDYWIGEQIGETGCFGLNYYFNFTDIIYDLAEDAPKGLICDWQNDYIEANYDKAIEEREVINYRSYIKGARFKDM